jgi:hypothetical protein
MSIHVTRRSLGGLAGGAASCGLLSPASAIELANPKDKIILTITGSITTTNNGDAAVFDRPMLETLGTSSIETTNPWYNGIVRFDGVRMDALMRFVGATGDTLTVVALNDFSTEIPISDFVRYGVLLALKRDGNYMPVRDKGPLFIVYPYDSSPELHAQKYFNRSAWQVARFIVH